MTRDEILNMPAGRELDALVWMALHGQEPNILVCRHVDGDYQPHAGYPSGHISPPHYSTDIAAAWEVDKVTEIAMLNKVHGTWEAYCFTPSKERSLCGKDKSAPLAICRAALLVFAWVVAGLAMLASQIEEGEK
jgi:hypothetical protein